MHRERCLLQDWHAWWPMARSSSHLIMPRGAFVAQSNSSATEVINAPPIKAAKGYMGKCIPVGLIPRRVFTRTHIHSISYGDLVRVH